MLLDVIREGCKRTASRWNAKKLRRASRWRSGRPEIVQRARISSAKRGDKRCQYRTLDSADSPVFDPLTTRKIDKSLTSPFTSGKSSCLHGLTVSGVSGVPQAAPRGAAGGGTHPGGGGGEARPAPELRLQMRIRGKAGGCGGVAGIRRALQERPEFLRWVRAQSHSVPARVHSFRFGSTHSGWSLAGLLTRVLTG